jgi:hypothetical protein
MKIMGEENTRGVNNIMPNLIKVNIEGVDVWIEAEGPLSEQEGPQKVSVSESMGKTIDSFHMMSATIKAFCTSLVKTFKSLASEHAPDNITAEFGLKLSGEGNVYVVKTTGEASLKITAEWKLR